MGWGPLGTGRELCTGQGLVEMRSATGQDLLMFCLARISCLFSLRDPLSLLSGGGSAACIC